MNQFEDHNEQRQLTPEEEAKVRRATIILYTVMIIFVSAPFVAWYFLKR